MKDNPHGSSRLMNETQPETTAYRLPWDPGPGPTWACTFYDVIMITPELTKSTDLRNYLILGLSKKLS